MLEKEIIDMIHKVSQQKERERELPKQELE